MMTEYTDHLKASWDALGGGKDSGEKTWADYFQNLIEKKAKELYEKDGFNYGCFPTDEAWSKDRENVRQRYRQKAMEQ